MASGTDRATEEVEQEQEVSVAQAARVSLHANALGPTPSPSRLGPTGAVLRYWLRLGATRYSSALVYSSRRPDMATDIRTSQMAMKHSAETKSATDSSIGVISLLCGLTLG